MILVSHLLLRTLYVSLYRLYVLNCSSLCVLCLMWVFVFPLPRFRQCCDMRLFVLFVSAWLLFVWGYFSHYFLVSGLWVFLIAVCKKFMSSLWHFREFRGLSANPQNTSQLGIYRGGLWEIFYFLTNLHLPRTPPSNCLSNLLLLHFWSSNCIAVKVCWLRLISYLHLIHYMCLSYTFLYVGFLSLVSPCYKVRSWLVCV